MSESITIGVVALQGAYFEHISMFLKFPNVSVVEVRKPEDLAECDGIVIPGGESTVIGKLAASSGLLEPLKSWTNANRPSWGTCAGMIMLANRIEGSSVERQELLGGLDCTVRRNYFGSQSGSFTQSLTFEGTPCTAVFIRAPAVTEVGPGVTVLSTVKYAVKSKDAFDPLGAEVVVAVQQGNLMGTAFHPELVPTDARWHEKFVHLVREHKQRRQ